MARALILLLCLLSPIEGLPGGNPLEANREDGATDPRANATKESVIRLTIRDEATGHLTPARFSVTIDGDPFVPESLGPHGLRFVSIHESKQQISTVSYARGTGPVEFTVPSADSAIDVHAAKGFEYRPNTDRALIQDGITELDVTLQRWSDLTETGWIATDEHVHYDRLSPDQDRDWLTMLAADGLQQAHFMVLKGGKVPGIWARQYAYGPDGQAADRRARIIPGEEYRDSAQGHINLLGLGEVIEPISTGGIGSPPIPENFPPLHTVLLKARARGGMGGVAHGGAYGRESTAILDTVLGAVDFFEITNAHLYNLSLWYRLLNCGFNLPPAGGTDLPNFPFRDPWQPFLGSMRMYVHTAGENTWPAWQEGLRSGKVFVSSGPLIRFTVNGRPLGSTIDVPKAGARLHLQARLQSPLPLSELEIIHNGEPVDCEVQRTSESGIETLTIDTQIHITESSWFAARGRGVAIQTMEQSLTRRTPMRIVVGPRQLVTDKQFT